MSIVQPPIDLSSIGSSFQITPPSNLQSENIGWIVLLNESPYTLTFFAGGLQLSIPAWDEYPIQVAKRVNGQIIVTSSFSLPITIQSMLLASLPSSQSTQLVVSFFAIGEVPPSTVPRNLNRQTWIPNTINTSGDVVASTLQNDGNATNTQFIEATPTGAVSSTWNGIVDGTLVLKGFNGGVLTTLLQTIPSAAAAATSVSLGDSTRQVEILGTGKIDGTLAIAGGVSLGTSPPTPQTLANGNTISLPTGLLKIVTNSGAVTGIIMALGTAVGQMVLLMNIGTNSVTMAAAGSNCRRGSNLVIAPGNMSWLYFYSDNLWYSMDAS